VNHVEGHENLTTKDLLFLNMRNQCEVTSYLALLIQRQSLNVFDFLPLTFMVDFSSDGTNDQLETFKTIHKTVD